jgi:hypothetical protein
MLLLVNKTFDPLQDGVVGRRFSHVNHLDDLPLSILTPSVLKRAEELIARGRGTASGSHAESA